MYKSWQINIADGVENMGWDCALQRLRSVLNPVFLESIYHESLIAQMAFS